MESSSSIEFIYVLTNPVYMQQNIYKVGYSSQPVKGLMRRYHTAYGGDIILLLILPGTRSDETTIFKYLEKFRMNGSELVQLDFKILRSIIVRHFYMTNEITDITDKFSQTSIASPVKQHVVSSPVSTTPTKNRTTIPPQGTQYGSILSAITSVFPSVRKVSPCSSILTSDVISKFNNTRTTQGARSEHEFNKSELIQLATSLGVTLPKDDTVRSIKTTIKSSVEKLDPQLGSQLRVEK